MKKRKKFNYTLPFIILFVLHSLLLIYAFYKKKQEKRTLFLLLLSNIGLAYIFEYVVLNVLKAYLYKPKVLKNKLLDNVLGAVLSQGIVVPFTAVFLTAFNLGIKGKLFFSTYFFLIENLFVKIGVYKQHWWNTKFTPILIYFYFVISDFWFAHLKRGTPIVLGATHFFCINVVSINFLFVLAIMKKIKFGIGKVFTWREHFIIVPAYSILLSVFATLAVDSKGFKPKLIVLILKLLIDFLLQRLNLLKMQLKTWLYLIVGHIMVIYFATRFRDLVYTDTKSEE